MEEKSSESSREVFFKVKEKSSLDLINRREVKLKRRNRFKRFNCKTVESYKPMVN